MRVIICIEAVMLNCHTGRLGKAGKDGRQNDDYHLYFTGDML